MAEGEAELRNVLLFNTWTDGAPRRTEGGAAAGAAGADADADEYGDDGDDGYDDGYDGYDDDDDDECEEYEEYEYDEEEEDDDDEYESDDDDDEEYDDEEYDDDQDDDDDEDADEADEGIAGAPATGAAAVPVVPFVPDAAPSGPVLCAPREQWATAPIGGGDRCEARQGSGDGGGDEDGECVPLIVSLMGDRLRRGTPSKLFVVTARASRAAAEAALTAARAPTRVAFSVPPGMPVP